MKKILVILMVIAVVFTSTVFAENLYDLQQDKDWIDKKLEQTIKDRQEYQENKNEYEYIASQISDSLVKQNEALLEKKGVAEELKVQIDELTATISETEKDYAEKLTLLRKRIVEGYMDSKVNLLTILADSENITEFYEILELRKFVARYDQELIEDIELMAADLSAKKARADAMKIQYEGAIKTTEIAIDNLEVSKESAEKTAKMSATRIAILKAEEDKLEAEAEQLLEKILEEQANLVYAGGDMVWPVPANRGALDKGDYFGMRLHPIFHEWRMHTGIDIGAPTGANILAVNSGTVIITGSSRGYGLKVVIDHGVGENGGIATLYAHCSKILVKDGQKVEKGQVIALIGSTGWATGPHLHFEVMQNGERVDPLLFVTQRSGT